MVHMTGEKMQNEINVEWTFFTATIVTCQTQVSLITLLFARDSETILKILADPK